MEELICLHIPTYEELWYREKIMQDSDTMSYNGGYQLNMEGYDTETGCIAFPKKAWRIAAIRTHLAAGFTKCDEKDGILEFLITREQYFRQRADEKVK